MVWILDSEQEWEITVSVQKCRDGRMWDVQLKQTSDIMYISDLSKPF
jgi:hypothetical protein